MAGNDSGGPWGGGGNRGNKGNNGGGRGPNDGGNRPEMPEIDEIVRKGQEQLRVLMGGKGRSGGGGSGGGDMPSGLGKGGVGLFIVAALVLWVFTSFYRVDTSAQSVELFLGKFSKIGEPGLNFAPWPLVEAVVLDVTSERTENIGVGGSLGTYATY